MASSRSGCPIPSTVSSVVDDDLLLHMCFDLLVGNSKVYGMECCISENVCSYFAHSGFTCHDVFFCFEDVYNKSPC